jgi:transcriptional regulator with XRE-family HTH domain
MSKHQYVSYAFKEKDPVIDRMRTLLADENVSYEDVHVKSGVSKNTLYQWFDGKTRRPQYATVMAVARSLGYDMVLTKTNRVLKFKRNIRAKAA